MCAKSLLFLLQWWERDACTLRNEVKKPNIRFNFSAYLCSINIFQIFINIFQHVLRKLHVNSKEAQR